MTNKCDFCGKLEEYSLPFKCRRCGNQFCSEHILPENHDCPVLVQEKAKLRVGGTGIFGRLYSSNENESVNRNFKIHNHERGAKKSPQEMHVHKVQKSAGYKRYLSLIGIVLILIIAIVFLLQFFAASQQTYVYVVNGNKISVINAATNIVVKNITVATTPSSITVASNGDYLYVSEPALNFVQVVSTSSYLVVSNISVNDPSEIISSPNGEFVYVLDTPKETYNANNVRFFDYSIYTISTATNKISATATGIGYPWNAVVSPDGAYLYFSNYGPRGEAPINGVPSGYVSILNLSTGNVIKNISLNFNPNSITISPNGQYLYITNTAENSLSIINTATDYTLSNIPLTSCSCDLQDIASTIALTSNGEYAYVFGETCSFSSPCNSSIYVINTSTSAIIKNIPLSFIPVSIAISSDSSKLYVSGNQNLYIIDAITSQILDNKNLGAETSFIAIGH